MQETKIQLNNEMNSKLKQVCEEQNMESKIRQVSPLAKDIIKFNVGGQKFATSRDNLLRERSFFTGLLSSNFHVDRDEEGNIFIDRNPTYFQTILDYFRGLELDLEEWSEKERKKLMEEVKFYEIGSLIGLLKPKVPEQSLQFLPEFVTPRIILSNNNTSLTVSNGIGWNCAMLCNKQVKRYKIHLKTKEIYNPGGVMIGFAAKDGFDKKGANYSRNGYYISSSGKLYGKNMINVDYGPAFSSGSTLEALYDRNEISFVIHGKHYGIAFTNLPNNLVPAFDFHYGCALSIEQLE